MGVSSSYYQKQPLKPTAMNCPPLLTLLIAMLITPLILMQLFF